MYLVYLIYVLIHLVHIMRIISTGLQGNFFDITSSIMNILLHFVAFLLPYCMGISLNSAHHSYHKKIIDTYLGVDIFNDNAHYLCKSGNYIKRIKKPEKIRKKKPEKELTEGTPICPKNDCKTLMTPQ